MSKKIFICLLLSFNLYPAGDQYIINQKGFFRIRGINQEYTVDSNTSLSEFIVPMELYWPISRETSLFVSTNYASASGTGLTDLSGVSDTQIAWNYYLENQHIVLNAGLGLPTGKSTPAGDEFETSIAISEHYWNFLVPNLGQGFNLSPGITWALPLSDAVVVGLGLAYQIRGSFIPVEGVGDAYKPGNELLLTGGFDFRIGTLSSLSIDLILTRYSADQYDNEEVYKSGNKIVANGQFKSHFGYHLMTLNFRFRSKGKNQYMPTTGTGLIEEAERTYPNQIELSGHYRYRHSSAFFMTYGLEGRFYQEKAYYSAMNLFGIVLLPEYSISKSTSLIGRFKLWTGSLGGDIPVSGMEIGGGLTRTF